MPIRLPDKCLRGSKACTPLAQIESDCRGSFICCGLNDGSTRKLEQDKFTVCWKNADVDDISDWDAVDIKDTIAVLAKALSVEERM